MNIQTIFIKESQQLVLTNDADLTYRAVKAGTIDLEVHMPQLPEFQALGYGDVVFDVGAYVGDTALMFAKKAGKVIGFEPQTDAWVCAAFNTRKLTGVEMINAAVGNGEPVVCKENPLCGNLGTRQLGVGYGVNSLKLDDYCDQSGIVPTFLKIDVEGFEPYVIRGAMKMLARARPVILVEVYNTMLREFGFTRKDVIEPLESLGYRYHCAIGSEEDDRCDLLFRTWPP